MERSPELLEVYRRFLSGQMRDVPVEQLIAASPAVSIIGTDPNEWITDRTTIVRLYEAQLQMASQGMQNIPENPEAWTEGDLGWVIDRPRVRMPDGREAQMRVTTIYHREDGMWKGVHQHASIGVPNDQVEAFRQN